MLCSQRQILLFLLSTDVNHNMFQKILTWFIQLTPGMKRGFWKWWYNAFAKRAPDDTFKFMNYGYHEPGFNPPLKELDENERYPIHLYHHVATQIDIAHKTILEVDDMGAGSHFSSKNNKTVKQISKTAVSSDLKAQALFKLVNLYQPKSIVELGTSLGLTTCYLANGKRNSKLTTVEGSKSIYEIAIKNFKKMGLQKINAINAPPKKGDIKYSEADIQLAKNYLNYFSKIELKDGIKKLM